MGLRRSSAVRRQSDRPPRPDRSQFLREPVRPGYVYPTLYVTEGEFSRVPMPQSWHRFVVIRDLRDTLVSGYFSVKISHVPFQVPEMSQLRSRLREVDFEQGMLLLMNEWLPLNAEIQRSWVESGEHLTRYEDLLDDAEGIFARELIDRCRLPVSRRRLRRAVRRVRFERLSGGRARGEEDVSSHQRKAVAGDWRNHFSDRLRGEFKQRWGELLIAAGYESDLDW